MVIQFPSHSRTTCHVSFYYKAFRLQNWIAPKHQTQYPSSSQMTLFEKHWWRNMDHVTPQPPVHWLSIGNLSRLNHRWKHNWVTKIELSNPSCKTSVFSSHYLGKTMKDSAWWSKALPSTNSSTYRNFNSLNTQGYLHNCQRWTLSNSCKRWALWLSQLFPEDFESYQVLQVSLTVNSSRTGCWIVWVASTIN
jgi:hypothetical protein